MNKQVLLILLVVFAFSFIRMALAPSYDPNAVSPLIEQVDERYFSAQTAGHEWILLEFWARDCPPCLRMKPDINEVAETYGERVQVLSVNFKTTPGIVQRYGIQATPTLVLLRDGREVDRRLGYAPASELRKWIDSRVSDS